MTAVSDEQLVLAMVTNGIHNRPVLDGLTRSPSSSFAVRLLSESLGETPGDSWARLAIVFAKLDGE